MDRLTDRLARHPKLLVLACGACAAAGFPPLNLWPLAIAAMAVFALMVRASDGWRSGARLGWLFGLAHFTLADNWIATAFTYQAQMPAALGWAAVPLLACYLAVYPALAAGLARGLAGSRGWLAFAPALGAAWILAEWLRSWVFTGYAWGPLSLVLLGPWDRPGLAALLPIAGTYALSGALVALAATLAALALARRFAALALVAAALAAGMYWPAPQAREGGVAITLVQPDLRQETLADPAQYERQYQTIAALSAPHGPAPRLVLWPESGVPDYLREGYPQRYYDATTAGGDPLFARRRIASAIGPRSMLLTGAVDLQIGKEAGGETAIGAYNSVTAISGRDGAITGHYAKAHLVPYGEYLPLRDLLGPLGASRLVAGSIDFIPGPGPRTLDFGPFGKAGMQICYEIIFSGEVVDPKLRPDYLFNPSNDGWFGDWGPPQHFAQARMRAIEEGLPVLRATTTGISGVIDAHGVVRGAIQRHRAERLDTHVPEALPPTLFARFGPWLTFAWGLVLAGISLVAMRLRRR